MACISPFEGAFRKEGDEEGLSCYAVRFETRGKEFISVARLIQEVVAKAKLSQLR